MPQMQLVPQHMALAYQLGGMALSPPPRAQPHAHAGVMAPAPPGAGPSAAASMGPGAVMAPPGYVPAGLPHAHAHAHAAACPQPVMVVGTDSKTVKIRGLPFRATPLDIFHFFEGYDAVVESLQLGVDALGRPSGEAWLTFTSSEEALRAVRERNRHYLGNRYLELSLT